MSGRGARRRFPIWLVATAVLLGGAAAIAFVRGRAVDGAFIAFLFAFAVLRLALWWKLSRSQDARDELR